MRTEQMLQPGYALVGGKRTYVIEQILGSGGFGITYKVKSRVLLDNIPHDVHFAVKEYFPDNCWRDSDNTTLVAPSTMQDEVGNGIKDFINEAFRLQRTCHLNTNIVNVNEVFQANGTAYYVLEYLEGGDLRMMVQDNGGGLSEQQMLDVMVPIGQALQCLHDNQMLHLDIKPDNIVMRINNYSGFSEPVLIDFGLATHFDQKGKPTTSTPSSGVSPGYSPLEQYAQNKIFDPRLDVYAFSATCLFLLTGKDPDEAMNLPLNYVRSVIPDYVSEEVKCAIERGMSLRKEERLASMTEMLGMLGFESVVVPELPPVLSGMPTELPPELPAEQQYEQPQEQQYEQSYEQQYEQQYEQPYEQQYEQPSNFYQESDPSYRPRRLSQSEKPKKSTLKVILISLAIVIAVLCIVGLIISSIDDKPKPKPDPDPKPVVNNDGPTGDPEEDAENLVDQVVELAYTVETKKDFNKVSSKIEKLMKKYYNYYEKEGEEEFREFKDALKKQEKTSKCQEAGEYLDKKIEEFTQEMNNESTQE